MKTVVVLFVILLCTAFTAFAAFAGNELGNGGDLVAQEFTAAGRKLVQELREKPDPRIDTDKLADAVDHVRVTSAGHLTLHGAEVDAINYPETREIDVSRPRWESADPEKRASLVLHEYLGVIQTPDLHYEISSSYAEPFRAPEEKPKKLELGVGTSYGWNHPLTSYSEHFSEPGLSLHVGYALSPHWDLLLEAERQVTGSDSGGYFYKVTDTSVSTGVRFWFRRSGAWRPYLQANVGYLWEKGESAFPDYQHPDLYDFWQGSGGNAFLTQLGAGVRHSLLRDVNLDLGVKFQRIGAPWKDWYVTGYGTSLVFHSGVNVVF